MDTSEDRESPASERQGIQVITRMAALLRALEHRPDGLSLGELAKAVGLPRSTVQRIVDALDNEGFVIAASASSGVRLGPALLALAASTRFHIAEAARQTLEELAKECGETVDLSLVDQDKVVFIDQVSGTHRLTAVSAVGLSFSLHSSANGKAVLAAMSDDEIGKLKRRIRLTAVTPNTITSWDRLEQEIETIRKAGLAYDREENSPGISAVAAAIRSPSGELAAISIPTPTQRFNETERDLSEALLRHSGRLQQKLNR
jgi:DNA-binding IclR family transcriptional regulator